RARCGTSSGAADWSWLRPGAASRGWASASPRSPSAGTSTGRPTSGGPGNRASSCKIRAQFNLSRRPRIQALTGLAASQERMKSRSNQWGRLPGGSWGIVGLIVAALALWMLTGAFSSKKPEAAEVVAANKANEKFHVMVREQVAEPIRRAVVINGNTMPDQIVNLSAQVEGQVIAIGARKGTRVRQGDLIARLDSRDLEQHRAREAATLRQRELEYEGAQKLAASHYITPTELAAKLAALGSARSELKDTEFQIAHLLIRAPVDGIVEDQVVE